MIPVFSISKKVNESEDVLLIKLSRYEDENENSVILYIENTNSKNEYNRTWHDAEIAELTTRQFLMLTAQEFIYLIQSSIEKDNVNITEDGEVLNFEMMIEIVGLNKINKISLDLYLIDVNESERLTKIITDVKKSISELSTFVKETQGKHAVIDSDIKELKLCIYALDKTINTHIVQSDNDFAKLQSRNSNLIGTTVFTDNKRKPFQRDVPILSFKLTKKEKDTILLIHMHLCVFGDVNANLPQLWSCIDSEKTCIMSSAQTEGFVANGGHCRTISGITTIARGIKGLVELNMKFLLASPHLAPFHFINPNVADHAHFGNVQTISIVRVDEIDNYLLVE